MKRRRGTKRVGYLLVHGVGNQHRNVGTQQSVLRHMGHGVLAPIIRAYGASAVGWHETAEDRTETPAAPYGQPAHAAARIRIPGRGTDEVLMAEAVWSDRFRRPRWWLRWLTTLSYLARCLPAVLLLVGPDRRDRSILLDAPKERRGLWAVFREAFSLSFFLSPEYQQTARIGWRLLTLLVCTSAFAALGLSHPWLALGIGASVVALLCTRLNVTDHVITAATRDEEREQLLNYLENRLRWLEARCDQIVIIAHSQGGYLAHQLLARDGGRNQAKVIRFVGVGSGLKPIWILRQTRHPVVWIVAWLLPVAMVGFTWGAAPFVDPGLSACAAALLQAGTGLMTLLALPLASITPETASSAIEHMLFSLQQTLLSSFAVGHMTAARWAATVGSIGLSFLCGFLLRRYVRPHHKDTLELPVLAEHKMVWQEISSQHDVVGRMLLPTLPEGVEQDPVPVLGHPLRDHTGYFDRNGILTRRFAWVLLSDLKGSLSRRSVAGVWKEQVSRFETALRKQHDRRRLFHALVTLWVAASVLLPQLARGSNVFQAAMNGWQYLATAMVTLSLLFTRRARASHHRLVMALDAELQGLPEEQPLVKVLPSTHRATPTACLVIAAVFGFYGALGLAIVERNAPQSTVPASGAVLISAAAFAVLAAAVGSGYRVKRRWLVGATALAGLPVVMSSAPSVPGQPVTFTTPGVGVIATVVTAASIAIVSLTRAAPIPLPARRHQE